MRLSAGQFNLYELLDMKTIFYTGRVELNGSPNYTGRQEWATLAEVYHNQTVGKLGELCIIRENNPRLRAMMAAGSQAYGCEQAYTWCMGSLANYIAILDFLDTDADDMVWMDLDLLRCPSNPWRLVLGACISYPSAVSHAITPEERFKENMFSALTGLDVEHYTHILSSLLVLSRFDAEEIVFYLRTNGLDLLQPEAWGKIRSAETKLIGEQRWSRFTSHMFLELAHGLCHDWQPRNLFGSVDWYPSLTDRPFLHFHSNYKSEILEFLKRQTVAK